MMKIYVIAIFSYLGIVTPAFCIDLTPLDPDCVFYADLNEGIGTGVFDKSLQKSSGSLVGGPAWAEGSKANLGYAQFSTTTFGMFLSKYVVLTRTVGEQIVFTPNAALNITGTSPFMLAMTFQLDSYTSGSRTPWAYSNGADAYNKGWQWRIDGVATLVFGFTAVWDFTFATKIQDLNVHTAVIRWDGSGSGRIEGCFDGKYDSALTGQLAINSATDGFMNCGIRTSAGHAEYGGGLGRLREWKAVVPIAQFVAFAAAYHNQAFGINGKLKLMGIEDETVIVELSKASWYWPYGEYSMPELLSLDPGI